VYTSARPLSLSLCSAHATIERKAPKIDVTSRHAHVKRCHFVGQQLSGVVYDGPAQQCRTELNQSRLYADDQYLEGIDKQGKPTSFYCERIRT